MEDRLPNEIRSMHKMEGRNRILQQDVIHQIANKMSNEIGRPLDQIELRALISHIKKLDGNKFRMMDINDAISQIAMGYLAFMNSRSQDHAIYDTHEIMKQYIGGGVPFSPDRFLIKKECGTTGLTPSDLTSVKKHGDYPGAYAMFPRIERFTDGVNSEEKKQLTDADVDRDLQSHLKKKYDEADEVPVYGEWLRKNNMIVPREKSTYVLLDSRYRVRSTATNIFQWTISPNPSDSTGTVATVSPMQNIIYMQFSEFHIPYTASADNIYKKITLLIDEVQSAAVIAHENRHYHAMFDTEIQGNRILCKPDVTDDGRFRFAEPINFLKSITISFGGPFNPLTFLPDFYKVTVSVNGPNSTYLTFLINHNVSDGEVVYITDFTTARPQIDFKAIAAITDVLGHTVAVVNNLTLEINTDLSTTTMLSPNPTVECYITTRRVLIPLRFVYLS